MSRIVSTAWVCVFALAAGLAAVAETPMRPVLTLAQAKAAVAAAATEAGKRKVGGAIAVVDDGGHPVLVERLDGTFPAASNVSIAKARTAAVFRRPTSDFENAIRNGRVSLTAVSEMTPLQGGIPIRIAGQVVGAVGVSGASSAQEDEELAQLAAGAVR